MTRAPPMQKATSFFTLLKAVALLLLPCEQLLCLACPRALPLLSMFYRSGYHSLRRIRPLFDSPAAKRKKHFVKGSPINATTPAASLPLSAVDAINFAPSPLNPLSILQRPAKPSSLILGVPPQPRTDPPSPSSQGVAGVAQGVMVATQNTASPCKGKAKAHSPKAASSNNDKAKATSSTKSKYGRSHVAPAGACVSKKLNVEQSNVSAHVAIHLQETGVEGHNNVESDAWVADVVLHCSGAPRHKEGQTLHSSSEEGDESDEDGHEDYVAPDRPECKAMHVDEASCPMCQAEKKPGQQVEPENGQRGPTLC